MQVIFKDGFIGKGSKNVQWFVMGIFSLTILMFSGCGSPDFLDTYPVKGSISFNGCPMTGALVTLYPVTQDKKLQKAMPRARVEEDGSFTLYTYRVGDGVPAGDYKVTAVWPNSPCEMSREPGYVADQLYGRFASVERSEIKVTIKDEYNKLPEITLH